MKPSARPDGSRRGLLAAVGDANDPRTWSGIPFHFLQAARAQGVLHEGLKLAASGPAWAARRWAWNAGRVLRGDRPGGYQYSESFLEALWRPVRPAVRGRLVVNCFQLYAPSLVADAAVRKWFYIDQTLRQLFDHYQLLSTVGRRIAAEALERERAGYRAAQGVIAHSRWAAASVIQDYGVPASRVHVVAPGANLDPAVYSAWEAEGGRSQQKLAGLTDRRNPLRLVFVGKDWKRKGLDRLLAGFMQARRKGCQLTLRVLGCPRQALPAALREADPVEWRGFIDKRTDADRFLRLVAGTDIGCLLSRAEAGGIVLREYHALGLAILGTTAGGAPDHAAPYAGWLVEPEAGPERIAERLIWLDQHREDVVAARQRVWQERREFSNAAAARRVGEILSAAEAPR